MSDEKNPEFFTRSRTWALRRQPRIPPAAKNTSIPQFPALKGLPCYSVDPRLVSAHGVDYNGALRCKDAKPEEESHGRTCLIK